MARQAFRTLTVVLSVGLLSVILGSGCVRKPRLDLSGLDANPPGGARVGIAGDEVFNPISPGLGNDPNGMGWSSPNQPLGGVGGSITPIDKRWAKVVVYFAYDSAAIGPAEKPKLDTLNDHLMQHPEYAVVVEGHCDERGSDEYNRALGETRALVVRDYLCSKGITPERLETVSYGEDKPSLSNATGESEHSQNRRAEFVIGIRQ